ncbi:MAG: DUF3181 family protein [Merismopediaceae bacterium]|nr:DUF3181 family protein [Merismopediaceae bacterium]
MVNSASTQAIEALAAEIGENIYIDVARWHLYLAEAHLHVPLAEAVYPLLDDPLNPEAITAILRQMMVSLGAGQCQLPLADLIPANLQRRLFDLLEEYQQNLA